MAKTFAIIRQFALVISAWLQSVRAWLIAHPQTGGAKWLSLIPRYLRPTRASVRVGLVLTLILVGALGTVFIRGHAFAAGSYQVTGTVTDGSSNPISSATVAALDPSTNQTIASTTTGATGAYTLVVAGGTYNIQVTPPTGSGLAPAVALDWSVTTDTVLNFVLIAVGSPITVTGRVLDSAGNPLVGVQVQLDGQLASSGLTDSTGTYSIQVASGSYHVYVGTDPSAPSRLTWGYSTGSCTLALTQTTTLSDIIIPFQSVSVLVQDPSGHPLSGVSVIAHGPPDMNTTLDPITIGSCATATGAGQFGNTAPPTDTSGSTSFLMVPGTFNFEVNPPSGSNFSGTTSAITITSGMSTPINITLPVLITVSGRVLDSAGNPLVGVQVQLDGQLASSGLTDSTGTYSIQVASGSYHVYVGTDPSLNSHLTWGYSTGSCTLALTQTTTLSDIIIPFQSVSVLVQDPSGHPLSGVSVIAHGPPDMNTTLDPITIGSCATTTDTGQFGNTAPPTDTSGSTSFLMVPGTFNFEVNPLTGSGYTSINSTGIVITSSQTEVFVIEPIPPTVNPITAPSAPTQTNTAVTTSATFTDVVPTSTHTAVWNWGDGTTSAGTVQEANGSGTVTGSHSYQSAGVYTTTVTVTSNRGGVATAQSPYIVIYDPSAGYVTGAGWINSPAGAYAPNPSLTGKATFGFVAKYDNGASIPSGQTAFQFQVANLSFHSTAYQWLVISGAKAQYKGTGTINGSGNYTFLLTAVDGSLSGGGGVDKLRMKIWDTASGAIVYDNQMGADDTSDPTTAIGGGQIIIHS